MNSGRDPFDVLREQMQTPEPTPEDVAKARGRLEQAIAAERRRVRHWRDWRVLAGVAAAVALVLVAVPLATTSRAQAALTEIAQASREATPLEVPTGSFVATTSERTDLAIRPGEDFELDREFVAYLLPTTRQVWRQPEEQFVLIRTTVGTPVFFDPLHEQAYYAAELDKADRIGETVVDQFTDVADPILEAEWPSDPDQLLTAMNEFIGGTADSETQPADLFTLAANLLRETNPPPELRGSILEVLAGLPLDLDKDDDTSIKVSVVDDGRRLTMELSVHGDLLSESTTLLEADPTLGIPVGTLISEATYHMAQVVDELPIQSEKSN